MNTNPWNVASFDDFSYLNCPECTFHTKVKTTFAHHATKYHPLSSVFFCKDTRNELENLKKSINDEMCKDLVSKFNLPNNISLNTVDKAKKVQNDLTSPVSVQPLVKNENQNKKMDFMLQKGEEKRMKKVKVA